MKALKVLAAFLIAIVLGAPGGLGARHLDLPERLTIQEFWKLSADLSEPSGEFLSDNLVSNELSFAQVVPQLGAAVAPGGVYLGVGPEQNFTYLAAMQARMAFVLDIRRDNLLLHLMYKVVFDLSPDRRAFVARLFSRPAIASVETTATGAELMQWVARAPAGANADLARNISDVRGRIEKQFGLPLTEREFAVIAEMQRTFHRHGPDIAYGPSPLIRPGRLTSYAGLMSQADADGRPLGFLGTEAAYRYVRDLQLRNLVIPVVGNFAGPKALRDIGGYLRARGAAVAAFYVSNVEDYLGRNREVGRDAWTGEWAVFCANVASMPLDEHSLFVRPLGLAAFDNDRRLMVKQQMHIDSMKDVIVHPAGTVPALPSALSAIVAEVSGCR